MESKKNWFIAIDGRQSGPFSREEIISDIKNGSIDDSYYVFRRGMDKWQPIGNMEEYADQLFQPPPPPPPKHKKIHKNAVTVNKSENAESHPGKKRPSVLFHLFFLLICAAVGFFAGVFLKESHFIDADFLRHIESPALGFAGSFMGIVFGLMFLKSSTAIKSFSVLIGMVATAMSIYFGWQTHSQQYGPSSINIAGQWGAGPLLYDFTHTGGQNYQWTLHGPMNMPADSGRAWINPNDTITAEIKGTTYIFQVTQVAGNCALQIRNLQGGFVLDRRSSCQ